MKKRNELMEKGWFRALLVVIGSVLTLLVLTFSVLAIRELQANNLEGAPRYLVGVFVSSGLTRFISFLRYRNKLSLIRSIILLALDITLAILVIFAKYNLYIFSICGGVYVLSIVVGSIFSLVENRSVRNVIFNTIIITLFALLAIALFIQVEKSEVPSIVLIECIIIIIVSLSEVAVVAFSQLKVRTLIKIVSRTYALEIIFGLLTLMIAASLILTLYEPKMSQFPDALWYCFAVVTTTGFGDFYAVTPVGRAITVFLGIYGIVVVAVITSIIVNFYNETKGKDDIKELKNIKKDEIENKKKK